LKTFKKNMEGTLLHYYIWIIVLSSFIILFIIIIIAFKNKISCSSIFDTISIQMDTY
jgi:beta-lactamase regulating signal transducer with metallopeptidase domain